MGRIVGLLLALVFAVTTATAGRGVRCEMAAHCPGCPAETLSWTAADLDCPMVFPSSPESLDAERVARASADAMPLVVVRAVEPVVVVHASIVADVAADLPAPRPPGLEILRI